MANENTADSKMVCDIVNNEHVWYGTGFSGFYPFEGQPCFCGSVSYHMEKCKKCGTLLLKPIKIIRNEFEDNKNEFEDNKIDAGL